MHTERKFVGAAVLIVSSLLVSVPVGVAVATTPAYLSSVTIEELRTNPEKYNGQYVKTTGITVSGFESGPALSDATVESSGVKYLKEPSIYLNSVTAQNQRDCFSVGLPPAIFCTVDVTGLFEYGGSYGHASYRSKFQITGSVQPPTGQPITPGTGSQTGHPCTLQNPCTNMPLTNYGGDDYGSGASSGTYCPQLTQTLVRGSSGNQVLELQKFLSDYYDIPPTTIQTGYFGRITQSYVIKFQKEQGLPSYGIAGSMTRAAIARVCSGSGVTVSTNFSASPTSGPAPLGVDFTAPASTGQTSYSINFGDGHSGPAGISCGFTVEQGPPANCIYTSYWYTSAGTYTAQLMRRVGAKGTPEQLVGTMTITVSGSGNTDARFRATPQTGIAPLSVTFAAEGLSNSWTDPQTGLTQLVSDRGDRYVDFGDGTARQKVVCANTPIGTCTTNITHIYQSKGTFTAVLSTVGSYGAQNGAPYIEAKVMIQVQ